MIIWHLTKFILNFLPGRRLASHSAQELGHFSAREASDAPSAQDLVCFSARQAVGIPFSAGKDAFFCPKCLRGTFRAGRKAFSCSAGECAIGKILLFKKKRLPRMRKTLRCGRIYKPSSVLQTGARRHPKKLLSFICCSLPPSNGRATLDCWYTWPCRLQ